MEVSQHWRLKKERYSLIGTECPHCGHKSFPPRQVCPRCASETRVMHTVETPVRAAHLAPEIAA